jgi:RNA polymerase sigma factor for flagellar operon FliA
VSDTVTKIQIENYYPLVRMIALGMKRRVPARVELDDLVQTGMVALLECARRFDASKKVEFGAYAKTRIRGAILDYLRDEDDAGRLNRKLAKRIAQCEQELEAKMGCTPEMEEIAAAAGMTMRQFHKVKWAIESATPLIVQENEEGEAVDTIEKLPAPEIEDPIIAVEKRARLLRLVATLNPRLARVIRLHYMQEMPMVKIGKIFGVGEARISQLHKDAIARLRYHARLEAR